MQTKGVYPLYLKLTAALLFLLTLLWIAVMYTMWPGLYQWGFTSAVIVEVLLGLIPLGGWLMWSIMAMATTYDGGMSPILLRISNRGLYALFPLLIPFGKLFGYDKETISQALIDLINHLVERNVYKVEASRILLLTPHCLQQRDCVHKVTTDVHNCKRCGRCQVGELLDIADTYGCQFVVVTGGTLARMMIKQAKPKAIVAIACERDLVSGMADVFPIPVIGVLNERPCGPCVNTRVDVERIKTVVERLIDGHRGK